MSENGEKRKASFEGQISLDEALAYLQSLQTSLAEGTAYVQNGPDVVALEPEEDVTMEVEARTKGEKQSIKIALRWEKVEEEIESPTKHFVISATEPELVAVPAGELEEDEDEEEDDEDE